MLKLEDENFIIGFLHRLKVSPYNILRKKKQLKREKVGRLHLNLMIKGNVADNGTY